MPVGGQCYQEDLFYKTSENNGGSWSAEARITNDDAISQCNNNYTPDNASAAATQLADGRVWLFWESSRDTEEWWDIYYASSSSFPIHNISVTALSATPSFLKSGENTAAYRNASKPRRLSRVYRSA